MKKMSLYHLRDSMINLHVHTMYSLQDSVIKPNDLAILLKKYKQDACAITDHGSISGWYDFNKACLDQNIKPIFGNEFYCVDSYNDDNKTRRDHLVLLAMNQEGLHNIRTLQKISVEHFYYRPILSYEVLKEHTSGIYCTSACSLSSISKNILNNNFKEAEQYAEFFDEIFDGNFSLELQFHPNYADQDIINNSLVQIADGYGISLSVSSDAHFLDENQRYLRRAIQAISWHKSFEDIDESLKSNCLGNDDLILKFAEETSFDLDIVKKALHQTERISQKCNAQLEGAYPKIPVFNKHDKLDELFEQVRW